MKIKFKQCGVWNTLKTISLKRNYSKSYDYFKFYVLQAANVHQTLRNKTKYHKSWKKKQNGLFK